MKKIILMVIFYYLSFLFALSGCVSNNSQIVKSELQSGDFSDNSYYPDKNLFNPEEVEHPKEGMSLIYVYRLFSPPLASSPTIIMNNIETADLKAGGYFKLDLKPGTYSMKLDWSLLANRKDSTFTFSTEKDKIYYINADNFSATNTLSYLFIPLGGYTVNTNTVFVDPDIAIKEIVKCARVEKYKNADILIEQLSSQEQTAPQQVAPPDAVR